MKMKHKFWLILLFSLPVMQMWGSDTYMIEVTADKKVIHVDQLDLSPNANIMNVLEIMPELLNRGSSNGNLFSNYAIQVDGKDMGQSRDVILMQTIIAEVDAIEISTNPSVSTQQNGTGGVINIKLKPVAAEGVSGNALLDVSSAWDVQPSVLLNYKKGNFVLRSGLMMEYYRPQTYSYVSKNDTVNGYTLQDNWLTNSYKQETAKLHLIYTPTSQDELKVRLWESYARDHCDISAQEMRLERINYGETEVPKYAEHNTEDITHVFEHGLTFEADIAYKHKYNRGGELNFQFAYDLLPSRKQSQEQHRSLDVNKEALNNIYGHEDTSIVHKHKLVGELKSKHLLLGKSSSNEMFLEYGLNTTYGMGETWSHSMSKGPIKPQNDISELNVNDLYLSPFLEWKYQYNRWLFLVGARYQYYQYHYSEGNNAWKSIDNHTCTGNMSISCQVADHHHLRLMAARNIQRDIINEQIVISPYYNADLNYIMDWKNDRHVITMDAGLAYIYAKLPEYESALINANAQLYYRTGIFSMAFAGNIYAKDMIYASEEHWNWYYSLSFMPMFSFRNNWMLSGKILYNSPMKAWNKDYGDCFYTQLRVSKDIKKWNIHLELDDILEYTTIDKQYSGSACITETRDVYQRAIQIGVGYKF